MAFFIFARVNRDGDLWGPTKVGDTMPHLAIHIFHF